MQPTAVSIDDVDIRAVARIPIPDAERGRDLRSVRGPVRLAVGAAALGDGRLADRLLASAVRIAHDKGGESVDLRVVGDAVHKPPIRQTVSASRLSSLS